MRDARAAPCVTVSVTIGSGRDGQDGTGHDRIIEPYLALCADFTRKIASSRNLPMRFSRPPPSTTRPSLRVEIRPEFARVKRIEAESPVSVTASVTIGTAGDDTGPCLDRCGRTMPGSDSVRRVAFARVPPLSARSMTRRLSRWLDAEIATRVHLGQPLAAARAAQTDRQLVVGSLQQRLVKPAGGQ